MKSSLRSKLFLLTYGIILSFIAGLIIFNNSILKNYYIYRKNEIFVDAFTEVKRLSLNDETFDNELLRIESKYNISIQVISQDEAINPNITIEDLENDDSLYEFAYGNPYLIPRQEVINFIYQYNQATENSESFPIGKRTDIGDSSYDGFLFDIETNNLDESADLIGLFVATETENDGYLFYFNTITSQSIDENIWIFNSFTIVVGMLFMVLSAILMYFVSYRFTNPILQISKVADEIANLNFSNKVEIPNEDEIGQLGKSINLMSDELKTTIDELQVSNKRLAEEILYKNKVDKMRKDFIASASHELKTPLSLIMGYTEALKLEDVKEEDRLAYLEIIIDETNKMNKLVREMLNISQIERGIITINKTEFSVKTLVDKTVKLFSLIFKEHNINLNIDVEDMKIVSDFEQLQTVLINFLNNSINHIKEPKRLTIKSEIVSNSKIRLFINNTGEKIAEEDMENLWESFYKVDKARTRSYGGHGLGLAICKSIFDALDYKYGAKNTDEGVSFYFDIDLAKPIEEA
ncbi:MAG: HAMP domain-containing histidine kinase [Candidatus Izimaplasma sp.]|nr:HAMP domain-containing histidine kinase [Candidatus Izimaplasma bacterium]